MSSGFCDQHHNSPMIILIGCQTSDSASSSKFQHLAWLALLVALVCFFDDLADLNFVIRYMIIGSVGDYFHFFCCMKLLSVDCLLFTREDSIYTSQHQPPVNILPKVFFSECEEIFEIWIGLESFG